MALSGVIRLPMDKEKHRAQIRAWFKKHRKERIAYMKAWREDNREHIEAYTKHWRKANSDKIKAQRKNYRKTNPEKVRTQRKAYCEANPEKEKARHKAWVKANPDKKRNRNRKSRALKVKAPYEHINEKVVYLRDGWICQICHKRVNKRFKGRHPLAASLDHIIPLSRGGTHTYDNVQLAHLSCNLRKHNNVLPQGEQIRMF